MEEWAQVPKDGRTFGDQLWKRRDQHPWPGFPGPDLTSIVENILRGGDHKFSRLAPQGLPCPADAILGRDLQLHQPGCPGPTCHAGKVLEDGGAASVAWFHRTVQACVELPWPGTLDHSKTLTDEPWKSKCSFPGLAPKDLS